jgi:hypothetical protein
MNLPILMPFQMESFNGDHFVREEFLKLKNEFDVKNVVETGTCFGSSTIFFTQNFENVHSIEINNDYLSVAKERNPMANYYLGSSDQILPSILPTLNGKTIFFLDAHWENHCPLLNELSCIATMHNKPIIVIHDFYVPNTNLGYDSYGGQVFNYEWIKPRLDTIYGIDGYNFYYNSDEKSTEVKRGLIYVTPKKQVKTKKINVFSNYYTSDVEDRQLELDTCLKKNNENEDIDRIILFTNVEPTLKSDKIICVMGNDRPTYKEYFNYINENYPNDYNILANLDIYFGDMSYIHTLNENWVYALTRYDVDTNGNDVFWNHIDSQDVWVFNGVIKDVVECDFTLGVPGCDNAIAERLRRSGYNVLNPSLKFKTYHLHNTNYRTNVNHPPINQPYFFPEIY